MHTAPAKLAYTVKEAVGLLPWGKSKIYELIGEGVIPTRVRWGHRYIMHADLMDLLLSVETAAPPADDQGAANAA